MDASKTLDVNPMTIRKWIKSTKAKWHDCYWEGELKEVKGDNYRDDAALITVRGNLMSVAELSRLCGANHQALYWRRTKGIPDDRVHIPFRIDTKYEYNGKIQSINNWSDELGLNPEELFLLLKEGLFFSEAVRLLQKA